MSEQATFVTEAHIVAMRFRKNGHSHVKTGRDGKRPLIASAPMITVKPMDRTEAEAVAEKIVRDIPGKYGNPLSLLSDETVAVPNGWVFFYQSEEYVRTGNPIAMLAGNGPLYVRRDGTVEQLSTALRWEEQIDR